MTDELTPLREAGSDEEQALVHALRAYQPPRESRDRLLAALGITGSATLIAAAGASAQAASAGATTTSAAGPSAVMSGFTHAAATTSAAGAAVKPLAIKASLLGAKGWLTVAALAVTGASAVTYTAYERRERQAVAQDGVSASPAPRAQRRLPAFANGHASEKPQPPYSSPAAPATPSAERRAEAQLESSPHKKLPAPLPLAAELESLDAARSELKAGDARTALSMLDRHVRRFSRGSMGLEAQALRIQAMYASGRTREAHKLALSFVRAHDDTLLAQRLRQLAGIAPAEHSPSSAGGQSGKKP